MYHYYYCTTILLFFILLLLLLPPLTLLLLGDIFCFKNLRYTPSTADTSAIFSELIHESTVYYFASDFGIIGNFFALEGGFRTSSTRGARSRFFSVGTICDGWTGWTYWWYYFRFQNVFIFIAIRNFRSINPARLGGHS